MKTILPIAITTWREGIREPFFYVLVGLFSLMIIASPFITSFALGEELKLVREMGLSSITLCGLLLAVLSASTVITEEIENKTVLTLLSKPVSRSQFIFGKFLGLIFLIVIATIVLLIVLIATLWYAQLKSPLSRYEEAMDKGAITKEMYEKKRAGLVSKLKKTISAVSKGAFLTFIEIGILTAIAVAISTVVSTVMNIILIVLAFSLGHLSAYIYNFLTSEGALVGKIIGRIFYTIIPNLENFNVSQAIAGAGSKTGADISFSYMLYATSYGMIYIVVALLIAILLFKNREVM